MDTQELKQVIKPYFKPLNLFVFFFILGIILALMVILFSKNLILPAGKAFPFQKKSKTELEDQGGEKSVVINENGLIRIKTPEQVVYQTWDKDEVEEVFKRLESRARLVEGESFDSAQIIVGEDSYEVTLFSEGEEASAIEITEEDEEIGGLLDKVDDLTGSGDEDSNEPGGVGGGSQDSSSSIPECPFWKLSYCVFPPASPPPGEPLPSPSPLPSPWPPSIPGLSEPLEPDCSLWGQSIISRAVISNTVCTKEE